MLRKTLIALVASVALSAGVAPGIAAEHGGGAHGGPTAFGHGGGFHDGFRGSFHGRGIHNGWGDDGWSDGSSNFGFGFGSYAYPSYDSCWQPRRVLTPHGWRWIEARVCG